MPLDAGTLDSAAPAFVRLSFKFIDANGQTDSNSYITDATNATDAHINAMAVALGAATNASLYSIEKTLVQETVAGASPSNATEEPRESVKDNIVVLYKQFTTRQTQDVYIPAPLDSIFVPSTQDVDVDNALFTAVTTAAENLLPDAYSSISVRFSEHKGVNKKTRL